tara:strand:+ start:4587 stop:6572 length:1986 start_codon:yes stop_codon:yes gene_type:complete
MSNTSGLTQGDFDRITVAYDLGVGDTQDFGADGEVLISGGTDKSMRWGSNSSSLPSSLLAGTNITFNPEGPYTGLVETTISSTDTGTTYSGTAPIFVDNTSETISISKDTTLTTIADELSVVKVPNTLKADGAINSTLSIGESTTGTFDGSAIKTIQVLKVPNTLTFTGYDTGTFDGSSAETINLVDTNTTYTAGDGLDLTGTEFAVDLKAGSGLVIDTTELSLSAIPNGALANSTISGKSLGQDLSNLTSGTNITFDAGTTYNGSTAITISATDTNTEYTATQPISLSVGNDIGLQYDNDTIILDGGDIAVAKVPNTLTSGTNITFDTGTTYDGSGAITISATDTNTEYTATQPVRISAGNVVSLGMDDYPDGTETIKVISNELSVARVPNKLRAIDGGLLSTGTITIGGDTVGTYDGSVEKYIQVVKVPNTLTITQGATSVVFNGSSTQSITLSDDTVTQTLVNTVGVDATATNYLVYNVVNPIAYNNTLYPIDSNYNITGMTATHRYYHATVSFNITGATTFDLLNKLIHGYFRIDSANNYQSGYFRPVGFWTAFTRSTTTPPSSIGHEFLRIEFSVMIDLGASYATGTHDFYPVVGQYVIGEPVGVRPTNKTLQISYGGIGNKLFLKLTPIDAGNFTDFTTANPYTIPPSSPPPDDY